jgi:hypothetical protein
MPDQDVFPFDRLPAEIQLEVFDCLASDFGTLYNAIQVNKLWYQRIVRLL